MSVAKLDQIRYAGRIRFCKEGKRIYFLESHLLEYALSIEIPKEPQAA